MLRLTGSPATRGQRAMAAVLDSGTGTVLSHRSAAAWWRVGGCQLDPVQVTRVSRSRRSSQMAEVHIVRRLPHAWTTVLDGVPIARPELVALQLFALFPFKRAERWVERMWSLRLLDAHSLLSFLTDMGKRGRTGTAALRSYCDERGADYVPPASNLESRMEQILRSAGIKMRRQVDLGGDTWTGRVDFYHDTARVVLEIQSEMFHTALVDRISDRLRLDKLRADGITVVEATDTEVFQRPSEIIRRLANAIANHDLY